MRSGVGHGVEVETRVVVVGDAERREQGERR